MIATLGKVGTGFDLANEKRFDVWGAVRQGEPAGSHVVNPNTQYCANLGHKFDGESDMLYMRARYYEPNTGRFISEDPVLYGLNCYVYCKNRPATKADESGFMSEYDAWKIGLGAIGILLSTAGFYANSIQRICRNPFGATFMIYGMIFFATWMLSNPLPESSDLEKHRGGFVTMFACSSLVAILMLIHVTTLDLDVPTVKSHCVAIVSANVLIIGLFLAFQWIDANVEKCHGKLGLTI